MSPSRSEDRDLSQREIPRATTAPTARPRRAIGGTKLDHTENLSFASRPAFKPAIFFKSWECLSSAYRGSEVLVDCQAQAAEAYYVNKTNYCLFRCQCVPPTLSVRRLQFWFPSSLLQLKHEAQPASECTHPTVAVGDRTDSPSAASAL